MYRSKIFVALSRVTGDGANLRYLGARDLQQRDGGSAEVVEVQRVPPFHCRHLVPGFGWMPARRMCAR